MEFLTGLKSYLFQPMLPGVVGLAAEQQGNSLSMIQSFRVLKVGFFVFVGLICPPVQAAESCKLETDTEIIDAAIRFYVEAGQSMQNRIDAGECPGLGVYGIPPCINTFPYKSVAEFKAKNSNCCEVLDHIPGDEPLKYRRNLRGEKHPKMYIVRLRYESLAKSENNEVYRYKRTATPVFDCFGQRMFY